MAHPADLTDWAAGMYDREATVYLLRHALDGRLAEVGCPWIKTRADGTHWIDADQLEADPSDSGAAMRIIALARSLLDGTPVDLSWATGNHDPHGLAAIVGAVSIACGRRVTETGPLPR